MNKITINEITENNSFTEDSFLFEDLFFMPKGLPVLNYHLKLLRHWNIPNVYSNGVLTSAGMDKIPDDKPPTKEQKLDNALGGNNQVKTESNIHTVNKESALLDGNVKTFVETYKDWIKTIVNFFNQILIKREIDKEKVNIFLKSLVAEVEKNRNNALMLFGKKFEGILYVIPQTIETVILSYIIGDGLKLSSLTLTNLLIAALFHDIGMLKIPRTLLEKQSALTADELQLVRSHTTIGYKVLREVQYSAIIASGALQHHERMDGKGYPNGLQADKITDIAKIISVADAYCAAIATKPYKKGFTHAKEVIQDLLRGGGTKYSPNIIKELIKNISLYPIGSLVLLSDESPARVVGTSGVAMKPIIRKVLQNGDGEVIDLSKDSNLFIKGMYEQKA